MLCKVMPSDSFLSRFPGVILPMGGRRAFMLVVTLDPSGPFRFSSCTVVMFCIEPLTWLVLNIGFSRYWSLLIIIGEACVCRLYSFRCFARTPLAKCMPTSRAKRVPVMRGTNMTDSATNSGISGSITRKRQAFLV